MRKSNKEADEANSFAEIVKHVERKSSDFNFLLLFINIAFIRRRCRNKCSCVT